MSNWISRNLNIAWLILAIVAISFTGFFAVVISFARIPAFSVFFSATYFYRALCVHVVFAMIIWLMLFTVCMWHQYVPEARSRFDTMAFLFALISCVLIASLGFINLGESYLNDYLPVISHPVFWVGIILFFISFILSISKFLPYSKKLIQKNTEGQLVVFSMIVSLVMISAGLISYFITEQIADNKLYFLRIFWVPGHIQQFLNAFILLLSWHMLVRKSNANFSEGLRLNTWIKIANAVLLLSIVPILFGLFVDPVSPGFKLLTIFSYGVGLGVPVLIHTIFLIRKVKFGNFAGNTFLFSVILYYTGIFIAYGGMKSDLRITAHYHGVVAALTVALMGVTYFILKKQNILKYEKLARIQPTIFSIGMIVLILCLFFAGYYGAPRKTFGFNWIVNKSVLSDLNFLAIGATLSVSGGMLFIFYSVSSLFKIRTRQKTVLLISIIALISCSFQTPNENNFLGKQIANIRVFDSKGAGFFLYDLIKNKPTILSPVYTKCPHSCSVITSNLKNVVDEMGGLGTNFQVITFSFDTTDAAADLKSFGERWNLDETNWNIVSAKGSDIKKLLSSIDFDIEWNSDAEQYDHPNLVVMVTPTGKISRYIYGITPKVHDLKISVIEARNEQTSVGVFDGLYIRCFAWDPNSKTFILDSSFITEVAISFVTMIAILFYFVRLFWKK